MPIHGINNKDRPEDTARWLASRGDPYERTGADLDGRVSIDSGVYGVPETYVVDAQGRIRHKHTGAMTKHDLAHIARPLLERLRREASR